MLDFLKNQDVVEEEKDYYSIKEFSKKVGITAQTLYNWERKGLLIAHHRSPGGHRYYSKDQLNQFLSRGIRKTNIIYVRREKMGDCTVDEKYIRAFANKTSNVKDTAIAYLDKVAKTNITSSKVFQNCLKAVNEENVNALYILNKEVISNEVKIIFESIAKARGFEVIYVDVAIKDALLSNI